MPVPHASLSAGLVRDSAMRHFYPTIWHAADHDDNTAVGVSTLQSYTYCKHQVLRPNKEMHGHLFRSANRACPAPILQYTIRRSSHAQAGNCTPTRPVADRRAGSKLVVFIISHFGPRTRFRTVVVIKLRRTSAYCSFRADTRFRQHRSEEPTIKTDLQQSKSRIDSVFGQSYSTIR